MSCITLFHNEKYKYQVSFRLINLFIQFRMIYNHDRRKREIPFLFIDIM